MRRPFVYWSWRCWLIWYYFFALLLSFSASTSRLRCWCLCLNFFICSLFFMRRAFMRGSLRMWSCRRNNTILFITGGIRFLMVSMRTATKWPTIKFLSTTTPTTLIFMMRGNTPCINKKNSNNYDLIFIVHILLLSQEYQNIKYNNITIHIHIHKCYVLFVN